MPQIIQICLDECGCATIPATDCEKLQQVKAKAIEKLLEMIECVDGPAKIGNETYDHAGDCEQLLRFIGNIEKLCQAFEPAVFSAYNVPAPSGPSCSDLRIMCCSAGLIAV